MVKRLTKFALVAGISLALALTFSCSGDDGDEGGGGGSACPSGSTSLDGVWESNGFKITIKGNTGVVSALPPEMSPPPKVGDQTLKGLTSTGNLTWSGQWSEIFEDGQVNWIDVQLTMSTDGQTLSIIYIEYGDTNTLTRKCNNQSGGGTSNGSGGGSSSPSGGSFNYGLLPYQGKNYKTIEIGDQTWMAENLNYDVPGNDTDVCYDNSPANCTKYGRLYDWETANSVCPTSSGWHLPSNDEWQTLVDVAGGLFEAGKYLKSKTGWEDNNNGEDKFGFSALPSGGFFENYDNGDFSFINVGYESMWWTSSGDNKGNGYGRSLAYNAVSLITRNKSSLFSVRCVKDN